MKEYEYYITTQKLIPPIGKKYSYAAGAVVHEKANKGMSRISHDFGETWGVTEEDASKKMKEKVISWIKEKYPKAKYRRI